MFLISFQSALLVATACLYEGEFEGAILLLIKTPSLLLMLVCQVQRVTRHFLFMAKMNLLDFV